MSLHRQRVSEIKDLDEEAHDKSRNLPPPRLLARNKHWARKGEARRWDLGKDRAGPSVIAGSRGLWVAVGTLPAAATRLREARAQQNRPRCISRGPSRNWHQRERGESCQPRVSGRFFRAASKASCHLRAGCLLTRMKKMEKKERVEGRGKMKRAEHTFSYSALITSGFPGDCAAYLSAAPSFLLS